jgi:class 3 adenylate cyclase
MPTQPGSTSNPLGDHRLSAIVFTDVAGFSGLMEKNERQTMQLVSRDLNLITEVCKKFGGEVLKNTGDGCLAVFPSVEGAVGSAIKIQELIADASAKLPAEQILHHRIGIHLGDVFFGKGDVLGNGVNIAARLMAEAEPGGICVSQTVYDLVKGRLDVKAVGIGPRELKNIREAVHVYRLVIKAVVNEQLIQARKAQSHRSGVLAVLLLLITALAIAGLLFKTGKFGSPHASAAAATESATHATTAPLNLSPMQQRMLPKPDYSIETGEAWELFRTHPAEFVNCNITDNTLVMSIQTTNFRVFPTAAPWGNFTDLTAEAALKIHGGIQTSAGLQLVSAQGGHRIARVMIAASGLLRVDLTRLNGNDSTNRPMNPNDFFIIRNNAIHKGDEFNTLSIDIHDHQLSVMVNNEKIGDKWNLTPLGPATLAVITEGAQGTVGTFRRLHVWVPKP